MNLLLKHSLRFDVQSNIPGRMRLSFPAYAKFPPEVHTYLHYVQEALMMPKGVRSAELNSRIGTVLVTYDAKVISGTQLIKWVKILIETGIIFLSKPDANGNRDEQEIERELRIVLNARLQEIENVKA